eukprot:5141134-Lingulodinium_polyedra.AAC.1
MTESNCCGLPLDHLHALHALHKRSTAVRCCGPADCTAVQSAQHNQSITTNYNQSFTTSPWQSSRT